MSKAHWGQGLATEAAQGIVQYAFEHLQLSRLICVIDHDNQGSIHVATKIGMAFEKESKDEYGPFLVYAINK
jgi:ribosomal-protein-alanine N-acetyltransferase